MVTVRDKMKEEIFKVCGDMYDISDEVVKKIEDDDFAEAAKTLSTFAQTVQLNAQAVAGLTILKEEDLEKEWEEYEEEAKEKQKEYQRQMKSYIERLFGIGDED